MPGDDTEQPTVLVVDDEEKLADMYTLWLRSEYDVRTVYDGESALAELDGVDVVLLDRRMPGCSGDGVMDRLDRRDEDPAVVVVTAVDPDFDILDLSFDDYVCKPIQADELVAVIEQQLTAREHGDELRRYLQLATKRTLLELEHGPGVLDATAELRALRDELEQLEAELRRTLDDFDAVREAYQQVNRAPGRTRW
ncbi:response regulator [Haloarchaeobius iranensis]|uniref:HalX domain-containing protein n=1 Tax=Haloarchaeobius iranensis TaxID=996166 RepID=A0A1G9XYR8_9EURY|nr:response regulator [Haloarchaeobius iranensis]SDN01982.1 HalX domain-containing protein [Haloarchaeobius iranensis]